MAAVRGALRAGSTASREPFWAAIEDRGVASDVYLLNDRGAIYAVGHPRTSLLGHLAALAELVALAGLTFVALLAGFSSARWLGGRAPVSGRALLREVRASFYRTLFLAFVAAVVVPVVALALVTRAYMATSLRADIEREAARTVRVGEPRRRGLRHASSRAAPPTCRCSTTACSSG